LSAKRYMNNRAKNPIIIPSKYFYFHPNGHSPTRGYGVIGHDHLGVCRKHHKQKIFPLVNAQTAASILIGHSSHHNVHTYTIGIGDANFSFSWLCSLLCCTPLL